MTDDFKIEKGIPLPEKKTAKNSKWCLVMFGDDKLYQIDIRLLEGI